MMPLVLDNLAARLSAEETPDCRARPDQSRSSKGTMVDLTVRIAMAAVMASFRPPSVNGNRR
jgi:hypothetical protein